MPPTFMSPHLSVPLAMQDRRDFLRTGFWGLAASTGVLSLGADAAPTQPSGTDHDQSPATVVVPDPEPPESFKATEDNILGPYFRSGAPYRAKITPPLEPGETLVVRGRVWSFASKQPLGAARLDVWQANAAGRYDNDDADQPPRPGVFVNRARMVADETGYYEFETIKPGRYQIGDNRWRPAHIHYKVAAPGHKTLVTQLYFDGDPYNTKDEFIKPSLIIKLETVKTRDSAFLLGTFDIVLPKV